MLSSHEFGHQYGFLLWRLEASTDHYGALLTAILGDMDRVDDVAVSVQERESGLRSEIFRRWVVLSYSL